MNKSGMTRRDFAKMLGMAATLGLVDAQGGVARFLVENEKNLFYLAHGTARAEGEWDLSRVEGKIPRDIEGTLFRVAAGQKEKYGVRLNHLFDGDPYVSRYTIKDGRIRLKGQFINTPHRLEELRAGKMLHNEFGTAATSVPNGERRSAPKSQPSVNIIRWNDELLALSENNHPVLLDSTTLNYKGEWDFRGTLPKDYSFTAHPKFDLDAGVGYGFGIRKGPGFTLTAFRLEADGRLTAIGSLNNRDFHMVHDMIVSENHLILLIPPVKYDLSVLMTGQATPADALRFAEKEPLRIMIVRKDGTGKPSLIELPAAMVFHHGNAFEENGKLNFDTILTPDDSILRFFHSFAKDKLPVPTANALTRFTIDLTAGQVISRVEKARNREFPRFDQRLIGKDSRYLYTSGYLGVEAAASIVRHDLLNGTDLKAKAGKGRIYGEPVFVERSGRDSGWILVLGYDARRHETFLEFRDASTLDFAARAWTGQYIPLGFHGNFYVG